MDFDKEHAKYLAEKEYRDLVDKRTHCEQRIARYKRKATAARKAAETLKAQCTQLGIAYPGDYLDMDKDH